jgi:glycosyltransferase involved in cell wall biosynthesis
MTSAPRISLITPSFQQALYLEECLVSVQREQDGAVLEHIVVDGGSTDGSKAILEQHASNFAWWCCEKDKGQSDAINKGLAHATGDVFGWLNSDDAWHTGTLRTVQEAFAQHPQLLIFGGRVTHRDGAGERVFERLNDVRDDVRLFADPIINQPATFYRLSVVKAIGGVDTALRYVMDVELWWQVLFRHGTGHLRFEPKELAMFRMHDASKTVSQHSGFLHEMADLLQGLCERTGNQHIARILALGHPERKPLRGIPAQEFTHGRMVKAMSIHFLLKWHGHLHTEDEFRMMHALAEADLVEPTELLPEMVERWQRVRERVQGTTWNRFRIRRKITHLFR